MKNHELEKIAKITGAGKSTVSKALNHCFGVDRKNRERILEAARQAGVEETGCCDVYGIFPDRPLGFWTQVMEGLRELYESEIRCKFNICPHGSATVLTGYLDEAARLGAKLLLIGMGGREAQLQIGASGIPVFFLFENPGIVNTFSFTTDTHAEGKALRARLAPQLNARVLLLDDGSVTAGERAAGFITDDMTVQALTLPEPELTAARLARLIHETCTEAPDVIYAGAGSLRETALAASKLGMRDTVIVGHASGEGELGGVRYVGLEPDVRGVCTLASDAAITYIRRRKYPQTKCIRADFTINS